MSVGRVGEPGGWGDWLARIRQRLVTKPLASAKGHGAGRKDTVSIPVFLIPQKNQDLKVGEILEVDITSQDKETNIKLKIRLLDLRKDYTKIGLTVVGSDEFRLEVTNRDTTDIYGKFPKALSDNKEEEFVAFKNNLSLLVTINGKNEAFITSTRKDDETQSFQVNKSLNALA